MSGSRVFDAGKATLLPPIIRRLLRACLPIGERTADHR